MAIRSGLLLPAVLLLLLRSALAFDQLVLKQ